MCRSPALGVARENARVVMSGLQDTIAARYGRRRGLAEHLRYLVMHRLGRYQAWAGPAIDWRAVDRVAFVCQGNILRSPYAEAFGLMLGARVTSFGIEAQRGSRTPLEGVRVAAEWGVDLSKHRSRRSADVGLGARDLIAVMEPRHAEVIGQDRPQGTQVVLLGLFGRPARPYVQDPYGLSEAYLRTCYRFLGDAVASLLAVWREGGICPPNTDEEKA
jgi:protein-tyrosine phosphatase